MGEECPNAIFHLIRIKMIDGLSSIEDGRMVLSPSSKVYFHTVNAWEQPNQSGSEDIICDLLE